MRSNTAHTLLSAPLLSFTISHFQASGGGSGSVDAFASPPSLVLLAADEATDAAEAVREAQGTMLSLIEILSDVQSQLQAVGADENLPVDGAVLAATVEQVRQQQMVEMTVFERLVAMSSDDGSGGGDLYPRRPSPPYPYACRIHPDRQHTSIRTLTPPPTGQESELVTLTSCFSYMPYVDAHHIASVLAV